MFGFKWEVVLHFSHFSRGVTHSIDGGELLLWVSSPTGKSPVPVRGGFSTISTFSRGGTHSLDDEKLVEGFFADRSVGGPRVGEFSAFSAISGGCANEMGTENEVVVGEWWLVSRES